MRTIENTILPPKGYKAITLWPFVFVRKPHVLGLIDRNHEEIHGSQQKEMFIIPFFLWYVIEFIIKYISCEDNRGRCFSFTKEGKFFNSNNDTECILFPSKWNRNWSTFKVPKKHKHFEPFQRVLCIINDNDCKIWAADFYSHYDEDKKQHYLVSGVIVKDDDDNEIVPYGGNEDKLGKQVE